MGFRSTLILLMVVFAVTVAESSSSSSSSVAPQDDDDSLSGTKNNSTGDSHGVATCNGRIGDCIDETEEMMLDSEASRRVLANRVRYISYAVLSKNRVPCNRRGASYYNCRVSGRANPYTRGCTVATRCARRTS